MLRHLSPRLKVSFLIAIQIKKFIRSNNWSSGHRIRAELWKEICYSQTQTDFEAQRTIYRDTLEKLQKSDSGRFTVVFHRVFAAANINTV